MIDPSQIVEHMEVVGSDGEHVGTVDKLAIKLAKKDPAAQGRHHVINIELVASVQDGKLMLTLPAAEATQEEKPLES